MVNSSDARSSYTVACALNEFKIEIYEHVFLLVSISNQITVRMCVCIPYIGFYFSIECAHTQQVEVRQRKEERKTKSKTFCVRER